MQNSEFGLQSVMILSITITLSQPEVCSKSWEYRMASWEGQHTHTHTHTYIYIYAPHTHTLYLSVYSSISCPVAMHVYLSFLFVCYLFVSFLLCRHTRVFFALMLLMLLFYFLIYVLFVCSLRTLHLFFCYSSVSFFIHSISEGGEEKMYGGQHPSFIVNVGPHFTAFHAACLP